MLRIVLLGPPGSGKGTQANFIKDKYNIPHISTGEILREMYNKGTDLGKKAHDEYWGQGNLVPDDIMIKLIQERISEKDTLNGYILDGFPRTIAQAEALDKITGLDHVIEIDCSDEIIIKRLSNRLQCPKCKKIYGIDFPPKNNNLCNICKDKLIQRPDDKPQVIKYRLEVYRKQTKPLINYYNKKNLLRTIDGEQKVDDVFNNIKRILS